MSSLVNLQGVRFGRLVVLRKAASRKGHAMWYCQCDCGNEILTLSASLRSNRTTSCGCARRELVALAFTTHGASKGKTYSTWSNMKRRCLDPSNPCYRNYGGRGIAVCEEWRSFEGFYRDMGDRPDGATIERIDVNKGYSKDNCIWATKLDQARNKRNTIRITINGETRPLMEWAEAFNGNYQKMYDVLVRAGRQSA